MSPVNNPDATPLATHTAPPPTSGDRRIDSKTLLGDEGRVIIEHDGQQYLLRQTHAGKLILTK
ncbi:TPA: hemin uptake protein HemP [Enterobacter cancerogenus]|nr:hemin uptake protein HemP [Enterobacter cancerogenus]HDR2165701.1 hemin uptake protein HemP [Enterobacter cancerogenus]HDR2266306.1 hemin uptake protein HemP [Enterobacter cancerogenus]